MRREGLSAHSGAAVGPVHQRDALDVRPRPSAYGQEAWPYGTRVSGHLGGSEGVAVTLRLDDVRSSQGTLADKASAIQTAAGVARTAHHRRGGVREEAADG